MKYECDMIEDLLPLYKDGVCGPASTKAVEEHLADCPKCRDFLNRLNDDAIDEELLRERDDVIGAQSKYFKRKSAMAGSIIAAVFAVPILVCLIVNLASGHSLSWLFIVLAAMLVPTSLLVVPLMATKNKLFLTLTSFTVSLMVLLAVICIYTGGKWFFLAASAVLFGLTVLFAPILACNEPVRKYLGNSKGIVVMAAYTVTFFVMLLCIGLCVGGKGYFRLAFGIAVPLVAMTWLVFLIIRYLPVSKLAKTGILIALICAFSIIGTDAILWFTMKPAGPEDVVMYTETSPIFAMGGIAFGAVLAVIGLLTGLGRKKDRQ
ncbi:MAG: zf-HC2 domain-containing protein [Lachnospiraceae bacterium]|nr:zf-HC2 domain-containing protein [Lachnospiraceae bacterium]